MPEHILQLDRHLFHFINHDLSNPFFDLVMPYLRNAKFWIPLYIFIVCFCTWKYKQTGLMIVVLIALSAGFADFTSAHIIKPLVKRQRPCSDTVVARTDVVRINCGTGYSFPSTHATDHFAMAFFMILIFYKRWRRIWLWGILWAGTISFAQVYVGVHYPSDVLCGAIYGVLVGGLFALIFYKIKRGSEFTEF